MAANFEENSIKTVRGPAHPSFSIDSNSLIKNYPPTVGSYFLITSA